ncbi:hypothetical protein ABFS82_14G046800 [Erythranthe guttata]|uniref:RING-type E3 ubiquitin transferase n=1 Tax=Erythranthe guttata TaxID=4155 RepID=A0A022R1U1_ERYGU|nr:PREDICTED: RING-H2 finger protein ATL78-like [Erythranthe guttata]EYU32800.1 hypothetical protein MIMGU_mgv1a019492mg [Erythranthe guttata]|eukprot:XP_012843167.1 PREDICTED: RING-H2 finger protein ATL78-like [Erythranthe guttata]
MDLNSYLNHHAVTSTTMRDQPAELPPQFTVVLQFSCKLISSLFIFHGDSDEPELRRCYHHPQKSTTVSLNLGQFFDREETREIIETNLLLLCSDMAPTIRQRWVDYAVKKAREVVVSMPPQHNVVIVRFPATLNLDLICRRAAEEMVDRNNYMVPAAESWIEKSLSKKTLTEYSPDQKGSSTTCAVCLEDFSGGGEDDVSVMPCEHYFHGDCIGKWLRTSHYCPVCRFEVPTTET